MSRESQRQERVHSMGKFYCRRDFKCGGRTWKAGEEFAWRKISVSERRVMQMWDKRDITTEEEINREAEDRKVQAEKRDRYDAALIANRNEPEPSAAPEPKTDAEPNGENREGMPDSPPPAPKSKKSRKSKAETPAEDFEL